MYLRCILSLCKLKHQQRSIWSNFWVFWVIFTLDKLIRQSAMTLDVTRVQFLNTAIKCCIILPRCEYWTILWCATGGNREKNLLDSSISLSTAAVSSESFTLLFSVFKSCSSRIVAELRPKGLNPRVAASFVFCLFQRQTKKITVLHFWIQLRSPIVHLKWTEFFFLVALCADSSCTWCMHWTRKPVNKKSS